MGKDFKFKYLRIHILFDEEILTTDITFVYHQTKLRVYREKTRWL